MVLFFVLSGFLITYLLLSEELYNGSINIKNFYLRRVFRIWPLYFLIILLALAVFPNIGIFIVPGFPKDVVYENIFQKAILYIVFLPNLVLALQGIVPYASHTWSIGTEEQYYLVWPVILRLVKKNRLMLMLMIIVLYLVCLKALASRFTNVLPFKYEIFAFWMTFNIDCMAIGGFFAVMLYYNSKLLRIFLNKYLFYSILILLAVLLYKGFYVPYVQYEFYAFWFGIVILNFAANDTIKVSLENRLFNYLGRISYGLYMYHPIGIVLSIVIALKLDCASNLLLYPMSIGFAILMAGVSYRYFETFFLKFKVKYSNIITGDDSHIINPGKENNSSG